MKIRRLWIFIILAVVVGFFTVVREMSALGSNQGYEPVQPINFSHKVHAGDNKMPCMYCHFAADKGRHAGIPPTELCLNCHLKIRSEAPDILKIQEAVDNNTNIQWIKVNHFPDFAYFNHSQHVRPGKLICQECHGPVQTMARLRQDKSLNMGWCITCHRIKGIAPDADHKTGAGGDCAKCHY